jgi:SAM-dependent methyltransferase
LASSFCFWENKHREYITKGRITKHNFFVEEVAELLPEHSRVLDLGCGTGRDSVYLAERGHQVTAADRSPFILAHFPQGANELGVHSLQLDIAELPYPFTAGEFDVVYAHQSLHYFGKNQTREIFREISRTLRPKGLFFALFNSVKDPECGTGVPLERNYCELSPGDRKRFFFVEEMPDLLSGSFTVDRVEYGTGTRKNENDQFVLLIATNRRGEQGA